MSTIYVFFKQKANDIVFEKSINDTMSKKHIIHISYNIINQNGLLRKPLIYWIKKESNYNMEGNFNMHFM